MARRRIAMLCLVTSVLGRPAFAAIDVLPNLQINGFGTVGAQHTEISQPWTFRRDNSEPGESGGYGDALADSRIGMQANYTMGSKWGAVGQFVLKEQGHGIPPIQLVDWAFISYQPIADLTLRLGRTSEDLFLLANYRDVGFAFPWVRPNTEFYGWLPVFYVDGIDVTETWQIGNSVWHAKTAYGPRQSTTVVVPPADAPSKSRSENIFDLGLSSEFNGITVKLSYQLSHTSLVDFQQLDDLVQGLQQIQSLFTSLGQTENAATASELSTRLKLDHTLTRYMGLAVTYDRGPWLLQGEVSYVNGEVLVVNGWRSYASFGYRIGPVTPFAMIGRALPKRSGTPIPYNWTADLTPALGAAPGLIEQIQLAGSQSAQGSNLARVDQRSVSLGARWDVAAQIALKFQWDYFHVYPNGSGLWGNNVDPAIPPVLPAAYANVFSTTLDFVF